MVTTLVIAVGSVLLVISGFTWAARREELATLARLERLRVGRLADATPGALTCVRGRVIESPDAQVDPVDGERVAYFEARLLRADRGGAEVLHREDGERLWLDDGSGSTNGGSTIAVVELEGAEIAVGLEEVATAEVEPTPAMQRLLEEAEIERPEKPERAARWALEHRALAVGDVLTLIGVASEDGGEDGDASQAGRRLRFDSRGPLFVTPEPLEDFLARQRSGAGAMDRMLKLGAAFGAVLIALGAALVIALG